MAISRGNAGTARLQETISYTGSQIIRGLGCWFYKPSSLGNATLCEVDSSTGTGKMSLEITSGGYIQVSIIHTTGTAVVTGTAAYSANTWTHAFVSTNGLQAVFKDGTFDNSNTGSLTTTGNWDIFRVFQNGSGGAYVAEVFYHTAFDPYNYTLHGEILSAYAGGLAPNGLNYDVYGSPYPIIPTCYVSCNAIDSDNVWDDAQGQNLTRTGFISLQNHPPGIIYPG